MASAETSVMGAAVIVGGVWGYRKLIEPHASIPATGSLAALAGAEAAPAPAAQFVPAFGFTFLSLSLMALVAPDIAKGFSVLIGVATLLVNGLSVTSDLGQQAIPNNVTYGQVNPTPQQSAATAQSLTDRAITAKVPAYGQIQKTLAGK